MLLATMRVTPCGEEGLRRDFSRVAPQALRVARARLRAWAVAASALATGNKKAQLYHPPYYSGKWPTAPFSSQRASALPRISVRASYTASCVLSRTYSLAYQRTPCLRTLQYFSL